jgi:hypothetical protein
MNVRHYNMIASAAIIGGLALVVAAAAPPSCSDQARSDMTATLATICPVATSDQAVALSIHFSRQETTAWKLIELACPPNPPPTSIAVAAIDIVNAAALLEPWFAQVKK